MEVAAGGKPQACGGTRVADSGGDDGPAIDAELAAPSGVAATADGGFLIADTGNHVVRKVTAQGVITRVAGIAAVVGSGGDDGPATEAMLGFPHGVAVTADGGFLVADTHNHVVRKVSADGAIARVAGVTGLAGSGGDDGPATAAQLNQPSAVAVTADGGFLIADTGSHLIRRVVPIQSVFTSEAQRGGERRRAYDRDYKSALHRPVVQTQG
jgi:predicted phage gp36 major capsid-like protein